jgi:AcrR family transcriptional regulator
MTMSDIKERLLNAAERIFEEQGLEAVSLRAVTGEVGVNIAAVNYHFGSKAALLKAMTQRFFTSVNAEQLQRLVALEERERSATVQELLLAYAAPIFALFDTPRGREWVQAWMMATRAEQPSGHINTRLEGSDGAEVTSRYYEALRRLLPHIGADELWWRFERANNLLMANQGRRAMTSLTGTHIEKRDERAWLVTFLAGALQSPSTAMEEGVHQPE